MEIANLKMKMKTKTPILELIFTSSDLSPCFHKKISTIEQTIVAIKHP